MRYKIITLLIIVSIALNVNSQNSRIGISLSNNVTSFPVLEYQQLFYSQFHPGLDCFKSWKLNKNEKSIVEVQANAGFFYHRFVQTVIRIYPSVSYSRKIGKRFYLGAGLGAGYAMAFVGNDVFKLNAEGVYEKKSSLKGRSQYIVNFEIKGSYNIKKDEPDGKKIFFAFKTFVQGTFVPGYVPVLPVNSLFVGISIPLKSKENEK